MKITCDYQDLTSSLTTMSGVIEDAMTSDDLKNIIFRITDGKKFEFIGVSQLITYRLEFDSSKYQLDLEESEQSIGIFYVQIRAKELLAFLNSYKSVKRTRVDKVVFSTRGNKVDVSVTEENLETALPTTCKYEYDNIPVKPNQSKYIEVKFDESVAQESLDTTAVSLYMMSLAPLVQSGTLMFSKMIFGEDKVVVFSASFVSLMNNLLPSAFKGVLLSHKAVNFLKTVICTSELVTVSKSANYICFKTSNAEAFVSFEEKLPDCKLYSALFVKEHAFVVDRYCFRELLRRLELSNDAVMLTINADSLSVRNSKMNQEFPLLRSKNIEGIVGTTIKVMPEILDRALIGDDNTFSPECYVYISKTEKGINLVFSDDGGSWFSVVTIGGR